MLSHICYLVRSRLFDKKDSGIQGVRCSFASDFIIAIRILSASPALVLPNFQIAVILKQSTRTLDHLNPFKLINAFGDEQISTIKPLKHGRFHFFQESDTEGNHDALDDHDRNVREHRQ
jgi:hypothetical protein